MDGYTAHFTPFHPLRHARDPAAAAGPITTMVYIGQPTNPQFLRDPALRAQASVAEVISASRGKSGKNSEYLFMLEKALEGLGLGSVDVHVTDLVRRVEEMEKEVAVEEEERAARDVLRSLERSRSQPT